MTTQAPISRHKRAADLAGYRALDLTRYPRQRGIGPTVADVEREMERMPHLDRNLRCEDAAGITHECRDMRKVKIAAEHLERIPTAIECFHLLCNGRYALWDLAGPALAEAAKPSTIESMTIATLGFSKNNIGDMVSMMEAGTIGGLALLCSHYFKGTNTAIWECAAEMVGKFPNRVRFASVRNHAKIAAIQLTDGRTITIESSANMRSCRNLEFMTIYGHPGVYAFHTGWINELFDLKGPHRDR